ncbi:MAG: hypothetical protein ABH842_01775 [Candidatus Micrarchaeota archaeon]
MRLLVLFMLCLTLLHSTTISGKIYDADNMKPLNNTIITVENSDNNVVLQQVCDSPYNVEIETGNYTFRAYYFDNGSLKYYSDYNIQVNQNNMQLDLILMPYELLSLSPGFNPPPAVNPSNTVNNSNPNDQTIVDYSLYIIVLAIVIVFTLAWFFLRKTPVTSLEPELDDDCIKVLKILGENEGRMVQKELREILKFSETKMSIIITELEVSGYIKKIKKGRGNVLKLVKQC